MNIRGKTCMITGANTGLGFAFARQFAAHGGKPILVCRNREKCESTLARIKSEVPGSSAEAMVCDLSSLKSIQNFLEEVKRKKIVLDILYNNAAVMKQRRTITEDGFEMMFQVNYLAPFILMNSLLDSLKAGSSAYIINNGRPSYKVRLNMDDLQFLRNYHMYNSFFMTKLCLLFATFELSRRPERNGVSVTMIDPGPFKSDLVRDVPMMGWIKNLFSAPVQKAADNILYHIDTNNSQEKNGKVFKEKKDWPQSEYWKDTVVSKQLWTMTESLLKDRLQRSG